MVFTKIAAFFMTVIYALSAAFSFVPRSVWYGREVYSPENEEELLFSAALIADTHSDSSFFNERSKTLRRAVCGLTQTDVLPGAIVIAGDLSNATDEKEYAMLKWCLKTFGKDVPVLPAAGNHDVRAGEDYEEARRYFTDFASFSGIETDKVYYSSEPGGYPFIVLGSEGMLSLEAEISEEQLRWFESELSAAVGRGRPVFIVCHQPLYNSCGVLFDPAAEKNYGVGGQSAALEDILRRYVPECDCPVFFISGHLHREPGEFSFDDGFCDNLVCVNVPGVTKTGSGGIGMALEIYPHRVLLRGRNYITGHWLDGCVYEKEY